MTAPEILAIRNRLGMTQASFAKLLGVSGGRAVRKWEKRELPIPDYIGKLARALAPKEGVSR